jgi:hypothetical protein
MQPGGRVLRCGKAKGIRPDWLYCNKIAGANRGVIFLEQFKEGEICPGDECKAGGIRFENRCKSG